MTRQKKSRKIGTIGVKKDKQAKAPVASDKRVRKPKGLKPGSRQHLEKDNKSNAAHSSNRDPRLGNKTPIDLTPKANNAGPFKTKHKNNTLTQPIASVTIEDNKTKLSLELQAIESDIYLQDLIDKQDNDEALTEEQQQYIDNKHERYQELSDLLGISDDDEEESEQENNPSLSDDDLWNKFNNSQFTDTEQ